MGGEAYWYFEKYNKDIYSVLQKAREREFNAGRYNPVIDDLRFPLTPNSPAPGAQHSSIDEAREAAAESGTRSILDLDHISDYPEYFATAPLNSAVLQTLYGTTMPSRQMVEQNKAFFDEAERGQGVYIVLYKDGKPDEILFAGISFD